MRLYQLIPFIIAGMMLASPLLIFDSEAHRPTDASVAWVTTNQIKLVWTHTGSLTAAQDADVDICRGSSTAGDDPVTADVNILSNGTLNGAGVVATTQTGESSYIDHSLAEGTLYVYTILHPDKDETDCSISAVALKHDPVEQVTKSMAPIGINLSSSGDSINVTWNGKFVHNGSTTAQGKAFAAAGTGSTGNHTAVNGLKIEYSSDNGTTFSTATSNSSGTARGSTGYTITGLSGATEYLVRVSAVAEQGSGHTTNRAWASDSQLGSTTTTVAGAYLKISTLGDELNRSAAPPATSNYATGDVVDGNLKVTLMEDRGWDRILNVALYTNITEGQTPQDSDTYIIWNYFDPLIVSDPHGYFDEVNVVGEQSGVRTQDFTFDISWNKPLGANDVVLETSDFQSNVGTTTIKDAWTSFPVKQVSHEVPKNGYKAPSEETIAVSSEETSQGTVAMLWDGGIMNHALLNNNVEYVLSDMEYFVGDEVIDVSQDEIVLQEEEGVIDLFENITLSQESMKIGSKYLKTLVISGTLKTEFFSHGDVVSFSISSPDGTESKINAVTTSERTFEVPVVIEEFKSGTYQFQPIHNNHLGESFLFKH